MNPEEPQKEEKISKTLKITKQNKVERKPYQKKRVIVPAITAVIFLIMGIMSLFYSIYYQSTDDAFVEGKVVSLAPKVSGQIVELYVDDNDEVKEGQIIAQIDKRDYETKLRQAQANLQEAMATLNVTDSDIEKAQANLSETYQNIKSTKSKLDFANKDYKRYNALNKDGICTKQEHDSSKTKFEVAHSNYNEAIEREKALQATVKNTQAKKEAAIAKVAKLKAEVEQAKLNLEYTTILAPQDGTVSSKNVEKGNFVQVAQPLMAIVSGKVWVVANFKETQLTHMKKGQPVIIKVDTYSGKKFAGHIDSIQRASGAKASLFPPENAVGSYVKVVQRIPVKIVFDDIPKEYPVVPGMSAVPKVKIR